MSTLNITPAETVMRLVHDALIHATPIFDGDLELVVDKTTATGLQCTLYRGHPLDPNGEDQLAVIELRVHLVHLVHGDDAEVTA